MGYAICADWGKEPDGRTLFHRFRYHLASGFCTPEDTVLDLGCGQGYGSSILASKSLEVWAYDMEESNISCAKDKYSAFNINFVHANLEEIGLPKCDVAVSFEVIEHLYHPKEFATKMKASTSKFIVVSVPLDQKLVMVDGDPQEENDSTHHSVFNQEEFDSMFLDENWKRYFAWRSGVTYIAIYFNEKG